MIIRQVSHESQEENLNEALINQRFLKQRRF